MGSIHQIIRMQRQIPTQIYRDEVQIQIHMKQNSGSTVHVFTVKYKLINKSDTNLEQYLPQFFLTIYALIIMSQML